jgi:hypothetical protein
MRINKAVRILDSALRDATPGSPEGMRRRESAASIQWNCQASSGIDVRPVVERRAHEGGADAGAFARHSREGGRRFTTAEGWSSMDVAIQKA